MSVRALDAGSFSLARELAQSSLGGTPYAVRVLAAMYDSAINPGRESRALVVRSSDSEGLLGVIVFGEVAGTVGTGKLHFVGVTASARLLGVASRLIDAAIADLAEENARFVLAELPDDPAIATIRELLLCNQFVEEARIPDFHADGVALVCFRREIVRGV
ncbi:MAG: GNAT family N-acetyltransferase [Gemmatimonadaceae bacterium]